MKPYKLPTLQFILEDFCYLLPIGAEIKAGDRWNNGDGLTKIRNFFVNPPVMEQGGLYRPVKIPHGLRIRFQFERAQTGDLSGVIINGVLDVDPHRDGPLPLMARENGMIVRELHSCPLIRARFPGDDFVVLTPTHKSVEAVEIHRPAPGPADVWAALSKTRRRYELLPRYLLMGS